MQKITRDIEVKQGREICDPTKSFKNTGSKVYLHLFIVSIVT